MALGYEESLSGNEIIDALKGAQEMVDSLERVEFKVTKLRGILNTLGVNELSKKVVDLNAMRAFIRPEAKQSADLEHGHLTNIECIGRLGMSGQMFMYLCDDETPIDQLSLQVYEPVIVGFDLRNNYGGQAVILQLPVKDTMHFQERIVA